MSQQCDMAANANGQHILIVGTGLAGSLLACSLGRMGYRVSVHERRGDPRVRGYAGGRSINLALSVRGIRALEAAGVASLVMADAIPMRGRMIHPPTPHGPLSFHPYSRGSVHAINSVSRGGLNLTLLQAAASLENVTVKFNQRCIDVDLDEPAAIFAHDDGTMPLGAAPVETTRVRADIIIGADGAFSPVRARLQKNDRFQYSQSFLEQGYKELHIPPAAEIPGFAGGEAGGHDGFALDPNCLHIWPRGGAMMIALPNTDKSFTCTLFWPFEGEHGLNTLKSAEQVERFFYRHYPDAVPLMPTLARDYIANPTGSLVTVRCSPWSHRGRVLVLGDAAHAIVPFFGQGMNAAFEDCRILIEMLQANSGDWGKTMDEFEATRKENTDAIADMALANFIEMRDKVNSRAYRWKKRGEHVLQAIFPDRFVPLYDMVSFSHTPYAEALRRGRRQDAILRRLGVGAAVAAGGVLALAAIGLWRVLSN